MEKQSIKQISLSKEIGDLVFNALSNPPHACCLYSFCCRELEEIPLFQEVTLINRDGSMTVKISRIGADEDANLGKEITMELVRQA